MAYTILFDGLFREVQIAPRHVDDQRLMLHRQLVEELDGLGVGLPVPVGQQGSVQVCGEYLHGACS